MGSSNKSSIHSTSGRKVEGHRRQQNISLRQGHSFVSSFVSHLIMNAQAGPSRSHPPLHIDLGNIMVDQPRYTSPLQTSASSTAPSLSIHRSSTQSGFSWNGPQTPRTERLSLTSSEWSISEDDVVSFGCDAERSISSVMLDEGKTGGWWVDLVSQSRS